MGLRPNFILSFLFTLLIGSFALAQNSAMASWTSKLEKGKIFIENKGQFEKSVSKLNNAPIVFGIDASNTKYYFTQKGLTFSYLKTWKKEENEKEREKGFKTVEEYKKIEAEERSLERQTEVVDMVWENANENVKIIPEQITTDYQSYTYRKFNGEYAHVNNVKSYKKITYKNLYNNIDVVYEIHPISGIKYSIVLHPGANPDDVKMKYSNTLSLNGNDVHVSTKLGDIIDHSPTTFYADNKNNIIASSFTKKGKTVSFKLDNYDNTKTVIIDPWTQSPNFATNWDCVWECERDGAGNIYLIGGVMPLQLIKYNSTGVLQWTYNTPYDTTSWLGTFATDLAGNSYVTQGSVAQIVKVSTAGAVIWNNPSPGGALSSAEFWNIAFNCDQTKLIIGGTGGNPFSSLRGVIYDMNTSTGNVNSQQTVGYGNMFSFPPSIQEVRSITPAKNGRYYFLTLDTIGYINQNFTLCPSGSSTLFKANSTYNLGYKCENYRKNNSGIMAVRANSNFVYTQNGTNVHKRSLATGAIITTATIPGGAATSSLGDFSVSNSGIDIDDCGNVYVGSSDRVVKYDANLNLITSIATTYKVYDVHVTSGGEVVICGTTGNSGSATRTGTIQVVNMSACAPMTQTCCDATICQPATMCVTGSAVTLTVATAGGTFSGPGVNAVSGSFNPATAGVGVHTIYYNLACGMDSVNITVSPCTALSVCQQSNGTLEVSNGVGPYTWQVYVPATTTNITNSATCTSCGGSWVFGSCISGGMPITSCTTPAYWSTFATGTNSGTLPASFPSQPIRVIDNSGTILTITTLSGIPPCTACPTITVNTTSQTNVLCFGQNTGAATVSASGGTGPYTYSWMPGSLSGATQSGLAAGSYTVTATQGTCTGTVTVTITQPASAVSASITSTTPTACGSSNGSATASGTGGTGSLSYSWAPSGGSAATASGLAAGSYTVTVTDANSCNATAIATVSNTGGPTVSITSQTNVLCFGQSTGDATVNATGGTGPYTYSWMPGSLSGAIQTGLAAGSYTVTATDATSCNGTVTVTITQPTSAVSASITGTTPATCGGTNGSATASGTGGTGSLSYSWAPSGGSAATASSLAAGSYTVTVTDANSCTTTAIATVSNSGGPTVSITSQTNVLCFGASTGAATVNATGGTGPYTYSWMPGSLSGATQSGLAVGSYTVTASDATSCTGTVTVTITQPTSAVSVSISSTTPTNCGASNGAATASASGGTGTISYSWAPSGGSAASASGLAAGTYTVTATDANGCTATTTATIANSGGPTVSIASQTNIPCFGGNTGAATASASGGTGTLTYSWSGGAGTNSSASNLTAGTYTVTVTDGSGCSNTATVTITQPNAINPVVTTTPATCGLNDGTASVNATGGTGVLTPLWNTGSTNSNLTNLAAGNYSVTVTDANGCTASASGTVGVTGSIPVSAGVDVIITQGGSTILTGTGPAGATFSWTPPTGLSCTNCASPTASPTQTTTYYLTVTQNGCSATDTVTVFVDIPCGELFVPNAFSPNNDGNNDMLYVMGNCITNLEFTIFDRWGEKVFETTSQAFGWDGTYGGKPLDAAVFVYYINAKVNGVDVKQHGNITLVK